MSIRLSKSMILSGRQCAKRLFLEVCRPELARQSASAEQALRAGDQVLQVARSLHPNGILVGENSKLDIALAETHRLLTRLPDGPIFEAAFEHGDVLVRADLLFPDPQGSRLVEVKAGTKAEEHHIEDCAIQAWVLEGFGLPLKTVELALVDSSFVYSGGGDYNGLLATTDVSEDISLLKEEVPHWVQQFQDVLRRDKEPDIKVGDHCSKPFECPFLTYCCKDQPEYPVTCLPRAGALAKQLQADGIVDIRDIPDGMLKKPVHERVRRVTITGEPEIGKEAGDFLRAIPYPRYYLDFETIQFAVPIWEGTRPYEQLPFQWSCHIEGAPNTLTHTEFLDTSGNPPMRALAVKLLDTLGGTGPILMYSHFEKTVINGLIKRYPDLEDPLKSLIDRLVDLLPIMRDHYYHPAMKGSWSIKAVLPTICAESGYGDLVEVNDGQAAQRAYLEIIDPQVPEDRRRKLREELLEYCKLDTLAMVKVAHFFSEQAPGEDPV